ncbi:MAG: YgdI/YgdR family lipoprotein [Kluyvera sp.]|uniref:YgdI/YgdR family lipoprotein n=1 Tax=Kluyvera sp. TaxID=1538228 RepID=UPI003A8999E2
MLKRHHLALILLTTLLSGCTTAYTMTTRTGKTIDTQGKPVADAATGLTTYADTFGYQRVINTSEIVQTTKGKTTMDW